MDFIIGILLVIAAILLLLNFTTISISDTKFNSGSCSADRNFLISTMQNSMTAGQPQPITANASTAINRTVNLDNQTYDYSRYYFVS
jgi:hypothetical protein